MPIELDDIRSGYNLSKINSNFQKIEDAWDEKLDRLVNDQGNQMEQQLDMNSNKIINHPPTDLEEPTDLVRVDALSEYGDFTGAIPVVASYVGNGVQTAFPKPVNANDARTFQVYIGGLRQEPYTDYFITDTSVVFQQAPVLDVSVDIYGYNPVLLENSAPVYADPILANFVGDGTTTTFFVSAAGSSTDAAFISIDGVNQTPFTDFTNAGGSIQFTEAPPLNSEIFVRIFSPFATDISNSSVISEGSNTPRTLTDRFADVRYIKDFGAIGDGVADDTDALILASEALQSGETLDLQGLTLRIVHKGVNFDPFRPDDPSPLNPRTTYAFFEKLDDITIRNGQIQCLDLDMTEDCLVLLGFSGCKGVILDNVRLILNATGVPVYLDNNYETYGCLVEFRHHNDGTTGENLLIQNHCFFEVFHPSGGDFGDGTGNPVHTYAGKMIGVVFYGDTPVDAVSEIFGFTIQDSTFSRCTARTVWAWGAFNVRIVNNAFINIGLDATAFANYVIRMTHWGTDTVITGNRIRNGYFETCGILISNNNSPRIPANVLVAENNFDNTTGLAVLLNAGYNVSVRGNNFYNCTTAGNLIAAYEQTNSAWRNCTFEDNKIYNCTGTSLIYVSSTSPYWLSIKQNDMYSITGRCIELRFHPQFIVENVLQLGSSDGIYLSNTSSGTTEIRNNSISDMAGYGIQGFDAIDYIATDNVINRCLRGARLTPNTQFLRNKVEDCTEMALEARRDCVIAHNFLKDGSNTNNGADIVSCSDASTVRVYHNTIFTDGSSRYGVWGDTGIAGIVMHNQFSGTFVAGEYLFGGGVTDEYNTNDSGSI